MSSKKVAGASSSKVSGMRREQDAPATLTPKLRFPGFRDAAAWKDTTLGEQSSILKGKGIAKADVDKTGKQPCIRYGELYTRYGEIIETVFSRTKLPPSGLFLSQKNDVIIPSSGETKIDIATASCVMRDGVALGGDLNVIRSKLDGPFLSYYLNGPKKHDIAKVAQGDTVVHLYPSQLEQLGIAFPSPAEQQKIAECLTTLDEVIAAQSQKLAALKTHKKGLMQQLFPREGETRPRLRFPEFHAAGEWETKRVDDRGDVLAGKALAVTAPGPLRPYLRTKNVLDGTIDLSDVLTMPMTDAEFSRFEVLDGDVLLNEGQSLGLVGRTSIYRGQFSRRCAMQNQLLRFRASSSTCPEFAAQAFRQCQKDGTFASVATQTTSVAHLGSSRFRALALTWPPSHAEQQRIATCFTTLDDLITAQSAKLSALKTHKEGLMQQLFPSPEEVGA